MRIQPHLLPARVVVDVVVRGADEFCVQGGGEAGLGFDGQAYHWLLPRGGNKVSRRGVGCGFGGYILTAMARGVPLEWEPKERGGSVGGSRSWGAVVRTD